MVTRLNLLRITSFVIISIGVNTKAQNELQSPCPKIFKYDTSKNENNRWYGEITLLSDSGLSGVWLRIVLDRPAQQLGNWFGEVKLRDSNTYLVNDRNFLLKPNTPRTVKFFIKYDPSQPIPRLVVALLNGRQICPDGPLTTTPPPMEEVLFTSPPQVEINPRQSSPQLPAPITTISSQPETFECGTIAVYPRPLITYGQETKAGEFPWHAALYHSTEGGLNYTCGGSLISRLHVITAAHCVCRSRSQSLLNPENLLIYLGKYYLTKWSNPGVQDHQVSKITPHPQYDSKAFSNDIAIIKLQQSAEFTDFVRPICLWEGPTDFNNLVGKYGTVVGWGFDENGKLTEELTMVNMPIVSKEACIYSYPAFFSRFTTSESYCAGFNNGTSACNGDSGGGMVFLKNTGNPNKKVYQLRGLVSVSVALQNEFKCDPQHYVVFTDVAKYLDFIKNAVAT